MTKREARKEALKHTANWIKAQIVIKPASIFGSLKPEDSKRMVAELQRIHDHLLWNEAGRPEAP